MGIRIIGLFIFLFIIIASIWLGGPLGQFVHFPSLLFVVIVSFGLALMKYRKGDGKSVFMTSLRRYSIPSGVIGCLIGFVQIGANVSDPAQIPAGVGVAILTIFYGLILYCIIDALAEQKHKIA
jgi:flagellar motor component MotA